MLRRAEGVYCAYTRMAVLWLLGAGCGGVPAPGRAAVPAVNALAAAADEPQCPDRAVTMWVDVADVPGQCMSSRQCPVVGGRTVEFIVPSVDSCGYAPATWHLRNCERAPVVFGQLLIERRDGRGAWEYDFDRDIARVAPGEARRHDLLQLDDGRYEVTTTLTRGAVIETVRASFEIPAPRMIIEGPARCGP